MKSDFREANTAGVFHSMAAETKNVRQGNLNM